MQPTIIEDYTDIGVDVGRIVRRILSHLSPEILAGLREVRILDRHERAFACYKKAEAAIEIYVVELLGGFPRALLKILYPLPYAIIGMAIGHELDHHVNRDRKDVDREATAEANIMKYLYPSLGIFKPAAWVLLLLGRPFRRSADQRIRKVETG